MEITASDVAGEAFRGLHRRQSEVPRFQCLLHVDFSMSCDCYERDTGHAHSLACQIGSSVCKGLRGIGFSSTFKTMDMMPDVDN